jgi:DNA polymerase III delta subunit
MIYILSGNDTKKKNTYLKKLHNGDFLDFSMQSDITKESLFDKAKSVSLFGNSPIIIFDNFIKEGDIILSPDDLSILSESSSTFIFIEEKLLALDSKKYKKYATIEDFSMEVVKTAPKMNVFSIADSFSKRDKIGTWILYRDAVLVGASPEEVSGIIFWKIKTMLLSGTKFFSQNELKNQSSELVSIYHKSHRGEYDFIIGLEQFILSSLSK